MNDEKPEVEEILKDSDWTPYQPTYTRAHSLPDRMIRAAECLSGLTKEDQKKVIRAVQILLGLE